MDRLNPNNDVANHLAKITNLKLANSSSPLSVFTTIYCKAYRECTVNYMEGALLLAQWLGDIDIYQYHQGARIPRLLQTYEMQQLGRILSSLNTTTDLNAQFAIYKELIV
jgi:hypothetical protein